ncbi:MAG: oligogalacturonate lyase, partial [Verrucomicrobiales bacterium VVV1]
LLPGWAGAAERPSEWIDPDTGHRVVRLSREPGTASLYFHQNAYSPDGKKLIVTRPDGISTIDLATRVIEPVVEGRVSVIVAGRKTGLVYYSNRNATETTKPDGTKAMVTETVIYATHLETKATREIAKLPRGGIASINADETLMLGSYVDGDAGIFNRDGANRPTGTAATFQADYKALRPDGTPFTFAEAKEVRMNEQLERRLKR